MGAPGAATDAAAACGVDACCVEHPAMSALAIARATNLPVRLLICRLPFHCARVQQGVVVRASPPTPSTSGDSCCVTWVTQPPASCRDRATRADAAKALKSGHYPSSRPEREARSG